MQEAAGRNGDNYLEIPVVKNFEATAQSLSQKGYNLKPISARYFDIKEDVPGKPDENGRMPINVSILLLSYPIPDYKNYSFSDVELVTDKTTATVSESSLITTLSLSRKRNAFRLHYTGNNTGRNAISISTGLIMNSHEPLLVGDLGLDWQQFGFRLTFDEDDERHELLDKVGSKRIPANIFSDNFAKSLVIGYVKNGSLDVGQRITLQNKDRENHLKCYEVEIFEGKEKNIPETTEFAPESVWQDEERHYCMIEQETYPLMPILTSRTKRFTMTVGSNEQLTDLTRDHFNDVPLAPDSRNEWFMSLGEYKEGIAVMRKSSWRGGRVAVVNRKEVEEFTPREVELMMGEIMEVKSKLKQV